MLKLVSVIIPCFNAQKWLAEAIDSCLGQTYPNIEIIVIDDGSNDNCLEILKSYGDKIIWESRPNCGGSAARNRGFALAKGEYIQFLDADDYILPEKIDKQVRFLEETGADVVYGDWQYQSHLPDGTIRLEEIAVCGPKDDFLESLLANDRWSNSAPLLFKRAVVERCPGWDESLLAAQDRDFMLSVAMMGAKFVYQPGCYAIYRQYGKVTVSTANRLRWLESHCLVMEKAERQLAQLGKYSTQYRKALAKAHFDMGREYLYSDYPNLEQTKYLNYLRVLDKALRVFPDFQAENRTGTYNLVQTVFSCRKAEIFSYQSVRLKLRLQALISLMQNELNRLMSRVKAFFHTFLSISKLRTLV